MNIKALVLASHATCRIVANSVQEIEVARTVDEALLALAALPRHLRQEQLVLIAALGKKPENYIFHNGKSKLLKLACQRDIPRIVFSHTACRSDSVRHLCFKCGADAVVHTAAQLQEALDVLFRPDLLTPSHDNMIIETSQRSSLQTTALLCSSVIDRRHRREAQLKELAGGTTTYRVQALRSWTAYLEQQMALITPLPIPDTTTTTVSNQRLRMVHISDTHNLHRKLQVPSGDLFVHTGDICGNYHRSTNLVSHFDDYLQWLEETICPRFEQIVFLAGNHDTYLDPQKALSPQVHGQAMELLQSFLKRNTNAVYLNNSSIRYRGLLIYGSPICPCRQELLNKRYISNGFERPLAERRQIFAQIPLDTDILLTHVPPDTSADGCACLLETMYGQDDRRPQQQRRVPRVHAYGHVHKQYGVTQKGSTLLLNGSQERILRDDTGGGPLVVNIF